MSSVSAYKSTILLNFFSFINGLSKLVLFYYKAIAIPMLFLMCLFVGCFYKLPVSVDKKNSFLNFSRSYFFIKIKIWELILIKDFKLTQNIENQQLNTSRRDAFSTISQLQHPLPLQESVTRYLVV